MGYMQYEMGTKPPNAPVMAWNSTPPMIQPNGLPPIRGSSKNAKKQLIPPHLIPRDHAGQPQAKW